MLKSTTIAALPAYPEFAEGSPCSSFANLSTNETSYTIRRFKYKFRFTGSASCRLRILWNETFKPTLTASVVYNTVTYAIGAEDPNPAHWTVGAKDYLKNFTGDPCGPTNPGGAPTNPAGTSLEFDTPVATINEPSSNGTIYITDVRWSVINPDDPCDDVDPVIPDCPQPIDYNPAPNDPQGIYQFSTESPSPYACSGGGSPTCTTVTASDPNCFPPA